MALDSGPGRLHDHGAGRTDLQPEPAPARHGLAGGQSFPRTAFYLLQPSQDTALLSGPSMGFEESRAALRFGYTSTRDWLAEQGAPLVRSLTPERRRRPRPSTGRSTARGVGGGATGSPSVPRETTRCAKGGRSLVLRVALHDRSQRNLRRPCRPAAHAASRARAPLVDEPLHIDEPLTRPRLDPRGARGGGLAALDGAEAVVGGVLVRVAEGGVVEDRVDEGVDRAARSGSAMSPMWTSSAAFSPIMCTPSSRLSASGTPASPSPTRSPTIWPRALVR